MTDLEKLFVEKNVKDLMKALKNKSEVTRMGAAITLGDIGDSRAVKPLIKALKDDYGPVRMAAAEALKKIGLKKIGDKAEEILK